MNSKFTREWSVVPGDKAYCPVAVLSGSEPIVRFHPWDRDGRKKATAIATLHNAMLSARGENADVIAHAIDDLPSGPWSVREKKTLYPATVLPGDGVLAMFAVDFRDEAEEIANYLVTLHTKATAQLHMQVRAC